MALRTLVGSGEHSFHYTPESIVSTRKQSPVLYSFKPPGKIVGIERIHCPNKSVHPVLPEINLIIPSSAATKISSNASLSTSFIIIMSSIELGISRSVKPT